MKRTLLAAGLSLALLSGCASYWVDRGNDLLDVAGAELYTGAQSLFNVRATKIYQVGIGYSVGDVYSWDGRRLAIFEEARKEIGISALYWSDIERTPTLVNAPYLEYAEYDNSEETSWDWEKDFDRGFWEFGARVPIGFLGVDAHVDVMQIFDFVLGVLTIDFARDDAKHKEVKPRLGPPLTEKQI